ncbi:hypothetical protein N7478_000724 [Penicillium angulare]|uniref:uncharacterized protein n=1 Tax=Penicillium angulare TaxID=116970 RepID=UPI00254041AC|nr:uncharacterized protein N7478_000724 [Penicillium angulare]KAJ5291473.1 hypothetical protein N7478_000724 [Penicillium angulare]
MDYGREDESLIIPVNFSTEWRQIFKRGAQQTASICSVPVSEVGLGEDEYCDDNEGPVCEELSEHTTIRQSHTFINDGPSATHGPTESLEDLKAESVPGIPKDLVGNLLKE